MRMILLSLIFRSYNNTGIPVGAFNKTIAWLYEYSSPFIGIDVFDRRLVEEDYGQNPEENDYRVLN